MKLKRIVPHACFWKPLTEITVYFMGDGATIKLPCAEIEHKYGNRRVVVFDVDYLVLAGRV